MFISTHFPLNTRRLPNVGLMLHQPSIESASRIYTSGPVFLYKLRYIVYIGLVEMATPTNPMPTIYRYLFENTNPGNVTSGLYDSRMVKTYCDNQLASYIGRSPHSPKKYCL